MFSDRSDTKSSVQLIYDALHFTSRIKLDQDFYIRPEDWMTPGPNIFGQAPLPATPGVNPQLVNQQTAMGGQNISPRTGLTQTESALLSNEEKAMRLRQRGMA